MGTDREVFCLSSIGRFIKETKITNIVLFMIESGTKGASSLGESKENHYFMCISDSKAALSAARAIFLAKVSSQSSILCKSQQPEQHSGQKPAATARF